MRHVYVEEVKRVRGVERRFTYCIRALIVVSLLLVILTEGSPQENIFWLAIAGDVSLMAVYSFSSTVRKSVLLLLVELDLLLEVVLKLPFLLLLRGIEGIFFALQKQARKGSRLYRYIWLDLYHL